MDIKEGMFEVADWIHMAQDLDLVFCKIGGGIMSWSDESL
jgi:hypothetical protein